MGVFSICSIKTGFMKKVQVLLYEDDNEDF